MPDQAFVAPRNPTHRELRQAATHYLEEKLSDNPFHTVDLDVRLLAEAAFEISPGFLSLQSDRPADRTQISQFEALINRRAAHEPVAYILGQCEFWSLTLKVSKDVLIPRADTETLIEQALSYFDKHQIDSPVFADIGTGSGAITAALLSELPSATSIATDISPPALALARENIEDLGFNDRTTLIKTSNLDGLIGPFDLIVSNPPYIKSDVMETLIPDVGQHEPALALDGGPDGLRHYKEISRSAGQLLKNGGALLFEIGFDQQKPVTEILRDTGFPAVKCVSDLSGADRCIIAEFNTDGIKVATDDAWATPKNPKSHV